MNCKSTERKLIFFLENNLPNQEAEAVAFHLDLCPGCREKMEYLRETLSLLDKEKTVQVNPFLFTHLQGRLEYMEKEKSRIPKPLFIAAALIIGLFSGILLGQLIIGPSKPTSRQEYEIAYLFHDNQIENMENLLLEEDF
jgi:hypothetical protein